MSPPAGWEAVHVCVDDATPLAHVEVLPDERSVTTVGFLARAIAWFAERSVTVRQVMSDNGSPYISRPWAILCTEHQIEHIRTRPYRRQRIDQVSVVRFVDGIRCCRRERAGRTDLT